MEFTCFPLKFYCAKVVCIRSFSGPYFLTFVENREFPADLVTFTGEILNGKLHFFVVLPTEMLYESDFPGNISKSAIEKNVKYVQS